MCGYSTQVYDAVFDPAEFETRTVNVWLPFARWAYAVGELHATRVEPSSEQVVLVTVPVVTQANFGRFACAAGTEVSRTVGGLSEGELIVHAYVQFAEPAPFVAVTTKRCEPTASPEYDHGEVQATAAPPSREQVTLVGEPEVVNANVAWVDVVLAPGPDVTVTLGAVGDDPESRTVPKSCVQYQ